MPLNKLIFKYLVYYPTVYIKRQDVPRYLKEFKRTQYQPLDAIEAEQALKLAALVEYARDNTHYHAEMLAEVPSSLIKTVTDVTRLPFTTKDQIKSTPERFKSREPMKHLMYKTTGGSTGQPVTIPKTSDAMARELAATWRAYSWAGVDIGDKQARFWGVPYSFKGRMTARLIDFVTHRKRCSAFSFNAESLAGYTSALTRFSPVYFYGYVSMLTEYADYFRTSNTRPPFNLRCIITTSEVLTEPQRTLLEDTFGTHVFNEYGCGELGSVAHECEKGSMHVMAENMIVEVLNGEQACAPGEQGELVITELNNRAMPLIRYRTGDMASLSATPCSCGRSLPVIENLYGRAYDMVRNKDGKTFHGEFFMYIIEDAKRRDMGIGAFQFIQEEQERFRLKVRPEHGYGERTREFITERIRDGFSKDAVVVFEEVDSIERAPSGKMRLIVSMEQQK